LIATLAVLLAAALPSCQPIGKTVSAVIPPPVPGPGTAHFQLHALADVPLSGPSVRFDDQSLDTATDRLYLAHGEANQLVVVDVRGQRVIATLDGFIKVRAVWAASELGRVYAPLSGRGEVAVLDELSLTVLARISPIGSPDALTYAPESRRVFVTQSNGHGATAIDVFSNTVAATIALGGDPGGVAYDAVSACVLVTVPSTGEMVVINPETDSVVGHYPLTGLLRPTAIAIDAARRTAYVAGAGNAKLGTVDLQSMQVTATAAVGAAPAGVALDAMWGRLYVTSESGTVSVFTEVPGGGLAHEGDALIPHAFSVAVDPRSHLVYLPLEDVDGRPVLRIIATSPPGVH
jgi:DNA-binding beta-propeller fold protein YncE